MFGTRSPRWVATLLLLLLAGCGPKVYFRPRYVLYTPFSSTGSEAHYVKASPADLELEHVRIGQVYADLPSGWSEADAAPYLCAKAADNGGHLVISGGISYRDTYERVETTTGSSTMSRSGEDWAGRSSWVVTSETNTEYSTKEVTVGRVDALVWRKDPELARAYRAPRARFRREVEQALGPLQEWPTCDDDPVLEPNALYELAAACDLLAEGKDAEGATALRETVEAFAPTRAARRATQLLELNPVERAAVSSEDATRSRWFRALYFGNADYTDPHHPGRIWTASRVSYPKDPLELRAKDARWFDCWNNWRDFTRRCLPDVVEIYDVSEQKLGGRQVARAHYRVETTHDHERYRDRQDPNSIHWRAPSKAWHDSPHKLTWLVKSRLGALITLTLCSKQPFTADQIASLQAREAGLIASLDGDW